MNINIYIHIEHDIHVTLGLKASVMHRTLYSLMDCNVNFSQYIKSYNINRDTINNNNGLIKIGKKKKKTLIIKIHKKNVVYIE